MTSLPPPPPQIRRSSSTSSRTTTTLVALEQEPVEQKQQQQLDERRQVDPHPPPFGRVLAHRVWQHKSLRILRRGRTVEARLVQAVVYRATRWSEMIDSVNPVRPRSRSMSTIANEGSSGRTTTGIPEGWHSVGKIAFDLKTKFGSSCEGTIVFKGERDEKKWYGLSSTYATKKKMLPSGIGAKMKKKWPYFDEMQFIDPYIKDRDE
uniref:Uncharacterized protein n=1 Tax=Plectus sambesii TaxID=2011161 RepID=A0A914W0C8_9BILA